jgi:hypothetical protein
VDALSKPGVSDEHDRPPDDNPTHAALPHEKGEGRDAASEDLGSADSIDDLVIGDLIGDDAEDWLDDVAWSIGPGPCPTLTGFVALQVRHFRGTGTDAGDLLAETLGELLTEVEITGAQDPATLRDRRAALAEAM